MLRERRGSRSPRRAPFTRSGHGVPDQLSAFAAWNLESFPRKRGSAGRFSLPTRHFGVRKVLSLEHLHPIERGLRGTFLARKSVTDKLGEGAFSSKPSTGHRGDGHMLPGSPLLSSTA